MRVTTVGPSNWMLDAAGGLASGGGGGVATSIT